MKIRNFLRPVHEWKVSFHSFLCRCRYLFSIYKLVTVVLWKKGSTVCMADYLFCPLLHVETKCILGSYLRCTRGLG
jgi:hypothetical protein